MQRIARTPDGRTLAIEEAGDPDGRPVLVHGGTPNSRHLYGPHASDAAVRGLRLISYDRPGYGGSTPQPGRGVADCAADVRAICAELGIGRLAMWGISGGGPHVLACAALLPGLVTAAASLASLAPLDAEGLDWFAGMGEFNAEDARLLLRDREAARAKLESDRAEALAASAAELAGTLRTLLSAADAAVLKDALADHHRAQVVAERAERAVIYFVRRPIAGPPGGTAGPHQAGSATGGPPAGLFLTEPVRGLVDLAALLVAAPWLATAPRGDGHGVLVLPGLLATDTSTLPLRGYLGWLGYHVRGWDLGRNRGPTEEVLAGLPRALLSHARRTGRPVSLVGWSLGGIYARELARRNAKHVRRVITLGSPFALTDLRRQSNVHGPYQRLSHLHADGARLPSPEQRARPIDVPSTSVYSRLDGIVSWQACVEPETERHQNVEVRCAHIGFGVDPATLWLIADRLALPAGLHRPFRPPPLLRPLYPDRR